MAFSQCPLAICLLLWFLLFLTQPTLGQHLRSSWQKSNQTKTKTTSNLTLPGAALLRYPLHQESGTQHVNIWIGEPPVRQTLIVDTGSRYTATTCQGCHDCGKHANHYLTRKSSTRMAHACELDNTNSNNNNAGTARAGPPPSTGGNRNASATTSTAAAIMGCRAAERCVNHVCQIVQKYTEGSSWKAVEVNDVVAFGDEHFYESTWDAAATFSFGCQTEVKGLFRQQYADGIMGFLRTEHSLIRIMYEHGVISRPSFSLCLHPKGGYLAVGAPMTDRHLETMKFTPIPEPDSHPWHKVIVREVWLNDVLVADEATLPTVIDAFNQGKGTILDSGTTDTYLPDELDESFGEAWGKVTGFDWSDRRKKFTYQEYQQLPTIRIVFDGDATLSIVKENYMEDVPPTPWNDARLLINRVYADENIGAVIGLNAMTGYDVYYDETRIGLAQADCV